jgi:hypothetical protein
MARPVISLVALSGLMFLAALASGCHRAADAHNAAAAVHGKRFLLASEPAGAVGVLDAFESFSGPAEVVLVGRIGATDKPWSEGLASFVIVDPAAAADHDHAEHEHVHGDDHHDCPFCAKAQPGGEHLALVEFVDEQGQVLPYDARVMFKLQEGQTVVVRGKAKKGDLNYLVVTADGLYVRQ